MADEKKKTTKSEKTEKATAATEEAVEGHSSEAAPDTEAGNERSVEQPQRRWLRDRHLRTKPFLRRWMSRR